MNSATTYTISTLSSDATSRLGRIIGQHLQAGDVIELRGDLGSGKTTLTKGILEGGGFKGEIVSPTFTLSRSYPLQHNLKLNHFDFYRLKGHDITTEELHEALQDPLAINVIEWPNRGGAVLPHSRLRITIIAAAEENQRTITFDSIGGKGKMVMTKVQHDYRP